MGILIKKAKRINELPPYLFAEIDRRKRAAMARGVDLIDLGIGDPDIPTPAQVVETLVESASKPNNHRYPNSSGLIEFREAVANWYQKRFNVKLDAVKAPVGHHDDDIIGSDVFRHIGCDSIRSFNGNGTSLSDAINCPNDPFDRQPFRLGNFFRLVQSGDHDTVR